MATTPTIPVKRKNIDLPVETLQKLSILAAAAGKSLKKYIETVLISKADSLNVEVRENPSPSADTWFNNPENIAEVKEGLRECESGMTTKTYTLDEIKNMLGV